MQLYGEKSVCSKKDTRQSVKKRREDKGDRTEINFLSMHL